ncbi:MAG: universal stress protein [Gammaproteobacteria bacterium]|nr:universal stress protein [Gammaproteobacteria bacterium]
MHIYQHILLGVDFSPESDAVIEKAKEQAEHYHAKLSLIHVVDYLPPSYIDDFIMPNDNLEASLIVRSKEQIKRLGKELNVSEKNQWVEIGSPKTEIIRLSEKEHVDLIIVGSHGRQGLQLLLGSTANAVLHSAPCDVLAVRITES